jgi:DNA-binding protein HU-beta
MTKAQLISKVASKTGMKAKEAEAAVNAVFSTVIDTLAEGEKVQIAGFGTFTVRERGEHIGRNPYTNQAITVPASRYLSFSVGKTMKEKL